MQKISKFKMPTVVILLMALFLSGCVGKTLRIATHAELKVLDPIWTTAYIVRNHGHLVYDTLFALDETLEPQPQMIDTWTVSKDKKTWTFNLRRSLKWHDGQPVIAEDCVASLKRWGKRDGIGQRLLSNVASLKAVNNRTFVMKLKRSDSMVLTSLAKISSNVPFMMPKRIAKTSAFKAITDPTGSGPFIFNTNEWVPGSKVVYTKNYGYVPRAEEMSLGAGGKIALADRIEWLFYPKQEEAVNALIEGKVDYIESLAVKYIDELEKYENITVASTDPLGNTAMIRFNALNAPFDNVKIRRAVLKGLKQDDYMKAALVKQDFWRNCYSIYPCGTEFADGTESKIMKTANLAIAKKELAEAGYDGEPVVILNPVDSPVISALTNVTIKRLKQMGMNVKVKNMDWATLLKKRDSRNSIAKGGWSIFHTWWMAADLENPLAIAFSGDPVKGWAGWVDDAELEVYREAYAWAKSDSERERYAIKVQERIWDIAALGILGQFFEPVAYNDTVIGDATSPVNFYWNMSVK